MGREDTNTHVDHCCEPVVVDDHCHPDHPAPDPGHDHDGDCKGVIQGNVTLHCDNHCHRLRTRSFVINIPPQTEPAMRAFEQATFNAWENGGYLVMAHSIVDVGAGWNLSLTIAWYV